ncbi:ribonuclease [Pseudomonas chlororaphis]|jgi:ribonuclease T2|uniref:Ribonuclease T2 n=1 Tax=Pseudomonas morbosilactucae TaxID=2938197 RepID=A0ABT0JA77_9PSED|nr:ribonuclease T2 [Pseudomonas morbosilactucae]MCK9812788.1 ribonuclease T2 [Pseudomonas morbosilactucae]ROL69409.1 ribonuclease [Pseudomonas chlororaphis]WEK07001.1 MAG: ribonuclease T2 [Pseudomonas sp.]
MKTLWRMALFVALAFNLAAPSQARSQTEAVAGVFDYYLLSLSWSPTFCLSQPQNPQCLGKGYGFVLHGLWPQYAAGGWPQSCPPLTGLSREARAKGLTLFPTARLLQHEWKKHGTCSGLTPLDYLEVTDKALAVVQIPEALQPSDQVRYLEAREVVRLFRQSNPQLAENGLAVVCRGPELSEVRVCLTRDLEFGPCGRGVKNQCRSGPIRLPPVR